MTSAAERPLVTVTLCGPDPLSLAVIIVQMCRWLGVSRSGFYEWRSRPESAATLRRELLKIKIEALFYANDETYGYWRMRQVLVRGGGKAGEELVRKLMRELGLEPCQPKPWRHSLTGQARPGRSRTWLIVTSPLWRPARKWLAISRTFRQGKGGFTSPWSSTALPG